MTTPLNTKLNIEKKWYGPESSGRFSGYPCIFLYYGDEGLDHNYTVNSLTRELDGWNWTGRISGHGTHIVFSYLPESDASPMDSRYSDEILDVLSVQKHGKVRVHTRVNTVPGDAVDDAVDQYVVRMDSEEYRNLVDEIDENLKWFVNESHYRDRVDFVIGFDGLRKNIDYIQELNRIYGISRKNIWIYEEVEGNRNDFLKTAKQTGCRVTLPPDHFRKRPDEPEE